MFNELTQLRWLFLREVSCLRAIGGEMVKFPWRIETGCDDFPVAYSERTIALMQKPNRLALHPFVLRERRHQAPARITRRGVVPLGRHGLSGDEFHHGGHDVDDV